MIITEVRIIEVAGRRVAAGSRTMGRLKQLRGRAAHSGVREAKGAYGDAHGAKGV